MSMRWCGFESHTCQYIALHGTQNQILGQCLLGIFRSFGHFQSYLLMFKLAQSGTILFVSEKPFETALPLSFQCVMAVDGLHSTDENLLLFKVNIDATKNEVFTWQIWQFYRALWILTKRNVPILCAFKVISKARECILLF